MSTVAFAQQDGTFQIGYAANLNIGDSVVNLSNDGAQGGVFGAGVLVGVPATTFFPVKTLGNLCANIYVFDPQEEEIGCCSCLVTPNGLDSLSTQQDLVSNKLTPGIVDSVVIKLLASAPSGTGTCNAASPTVSTLEPGLRGWATGLHQSTSTGAYQTVENAFQNAGLSASELQKLTSYCGFIQATGSGYGICNSCQTGGLGAVNK